MHMKPSTQILSFSFRFELTFSKIQPNKFQRIKRERERERETTETTETKKATTSQHECRKPYVSLMLFHCISSAAVVVNSFEYHSQCTCLSNPVFSKRKPIKWHIFSLRTSPFFSSCLDLLKSCSIIQMNRPSFSSPFFAPSCCSLSHDLPSISLVYPWMSRLLLFAHHLRSLLKIQPDSFSFSTCFSMRLDSDWIFGLTLFTACSQRSSFPTRVLCIFQFLY
jgi:hypothetical protein